MALLACVASSFASITLRFDSTGFGQGIDYVYNSNSRSNFAGMLNFTDMTNSTAVGLFCVDLEHFISGGQTYQTSCTSTISEPTFQLAGSVVSNNYASVVDNDSATALQIAVWAARYGCNLATNTGGTFQLESTWYSNHASIINAAIGMTTIASSNLMDANHYTADPTGSGQDQLGPVPEPATLIGAGIALAALARRKSKK